MKVTKTIKLSLWIFLVFMLSAARAGVVDQMKNLTIQDFLVQATTNDMFFEGAIDEIKVFDHPLSQEEVDLLYLEGNPLSVFQQEGDNSVISIYPNPASEKLNLDISGYFNSPLTFSVYSSTGVLVYQSKIIESNRSNTIDLSSLSKGLYFYTLKEGSRIVNTNKLIIQ